MATTTLYGGAPLPPLAPAADRLDASRGVAGGWNAQQRTTRRTALGVALAFACAGFAALALVTSPAYGVARAERDAAGAAGTRAGVHLASSDGSKNDAVASVVSATALGRADAAGVLRAFGDALPQPQHDRLAALMDAARVMPEETFARLRASAATAATATDAGETKAALDLTTRALDRVATMDERTASVVQLFFEDDETSDVEQTELDKNRKLAVGVTRLMDALRRFPAWTDADADAFERAVVAARAETWRRFDDAFRFANLGDAAVTKRPDDARGVTGKGDQKTTQPLLGVAASRASRSGPPAPFSSLAAAPGLATASALGSARRSFEGDGDGDGDGDETKTKTKTSDAAWGVGARSDAAATRALRDAFDPESIGLPRAFDAREAFPQCASLIGSVRDQGKCGSCWAVAATEVMNDRLCVASDGDSRRELSPQYALSCFDAGSGCDGGDVLATFREFQAKGAPFGGMGIYTGDEDDDADDPITKKGHRESRAREGAKRHVTEDAIKENVCVPYEFEPCDHPCQVPGTRARKCPSTCADGSAMELVYPKSEAYVCPPGDWACIAREISSFGSVAVTFGSVRKDFYEHKTGVYRVSDVSDPGLGMHATKLIGWGFDEEKSDPYWIMMNSWRNWGEDGAGRVGVGEMNIESGIAAVHM